MTEPPQAPPPIDPLHALRAALLLAVRGGNRLPLFAEGIRLRRLRSGEDGRRAREGWGYDLAWRPAEPLTWRARIRMERSSHETGGHDLSARLALSETGRPRPLLSAQFRARQDGAISLSRTQIEALMVAGLLAAVTDDTEALIDLLQDASSRPARLWAALRLVLTPADTAGSWSLFAAADLAAAGGPRLGARLRGPGLASIRGEDIEWNRQDGRRTGPRAEKAPAGRPSEGDRHGVETVASV